MEFFFFNYHDFARPVGLCGHLLQILQKTLQAWKKNG